MPANTGLQLVHPGEDATCKVDIIFLHGLRGDMEKTWTKGGVLWPAELLAKDVPDSRVFLFGYDSKIVQKSGKDVTKTELQSDAEDLCAKLTVERSASRTEDRPIILIAHSLGGLVVAQMFVHGEQSDENSMAKSIVKNIRGLIFLGTPFRGSVLGGPGEHARRILELFGVATQEHTLKLLGLDSEPLKALTFAFANLLNKRRTSKEAGDKIDAFFFYETLTTKIGIRYVQVVDAESARLPGCGDSVPIRASHVDICKFKSDKDDGYGSVLAAITKILAPSDTDDPKTGGGNIWINNYGKAVNLGHGFNVGVQHVTL